MQDSDSYTQYYQTLGIDSPCDLGKLKRIYKKLAHKWHPDRHTGDKNKQLDAEAKIKEINQAYNRLLEYHKAYQTLPPLRPKPRAKPETNDTVPTSTAQAAETGDAQKSAPHYRDPFSIHQKTAPATGYDDKPKRKIFSKRLFFLLVFIFAAYGSWQKFMVSSYTPAPGQRAVIVPPITKPQSATPKRATSTLDINKKFFTYGSTLGEVHDAQGTPTRIKNDIWYYGRSEVHFDNGSVKYWRSDLENPLNASSDPRLANLNKTFFTIGSSKKNVRDIQGKPDFMAEDSWEYGLSKVYFSNDRVIDWYNSPLDPLKAQK